MIHVTSLRVELSEQVTTPTILICNINDTIKICNSCKQFSTENCIQIREHCYIYDENAGAVVFLYVNTLALHTKDLKFKRNAHSDVM